MVRIVVKSIARPVGWLRRGALWTAVAGVAVVGTGGVALASDAATTPQIQACFLPTPNPAPLEVLHQAGSHCPAGFSSLTWNITGPLGIPGPAGATGATGPQGPPGPQGFSGPGTGVTAASATGLALRGTRSSVTVLTSPAVPATGIYYLSASLTFQVAGGDTVACQFLPSSVEATAEQVEAPTVTSYQDLALNGAVSLSAGQDVTVVCGNLSTSGVTAFAEGDLNAVLISNSGGPAGSANKASTTTHSPLKILRTS